jgi:hypothetical protein
MNKQINKKTKKINPHFYNYCIDEEINMLTNKITYLELDKAKTGKRFQVFYEKYKLAIESHPNMCLDYDNKITVDNIQSSSIRLIMGSSVLNNYLIALNSLTQKIYKLHKKIKKLRCMKVSDLNE